MESLYKNGLVKSLGVSNFSLEQLKKLYEIAEIPPKVLQNIALGFNSISEIETSFLQFKEKIKHKPAWVTRQAGGYGFAEMVDLILVK